MLDFSFLFYCSEPSDTSFQICNFFASFKSPSVIFCLINVEHVTKIFQIPWQYLVRNSRCCWFKKPFLVQRIFLVASSRLWKCHVIAASYCVASAALWNWSAHLILKIDTCQKTLGCVYCCLTQMYRGNRGRIFETITMFLLWVTITKKYKWYSASCSCDSTDLPWCNISFWKRYVYKNL